jgi:hypothetical protein
MGERRTTGMEKGMKARRSAQSCAIDIFHACAVRARRRWHARKMRAGTAVAEWVPDVPQTTTRTVREGASAAARDAAEPSISVTVEHAGGPARIRTDTDRWINEGGSVGSDARGLEQATAGR